MDTSSEYESNHFNEFYEQHDIVYGETFFFSIFELHQSSTLKQTKGKREKKFHLILPNLMAKGKERIESNF